jgi:AraC-like DNA-binding protein
MNAATSSVPLEQLGTFVEGHPEGGRIPRHVHAQDQLALISGSAAVIETDAMYVVHPLLKALWLPAGVEHTVFSPRPFRLHSLYFPANSVLVHTAPQVLGFDDLTRELVLFLCDMPRPSLREPRHAKALALLETLLPLAKAESFSLPRPTSPRARKLADHFTSVPEDARALEIVAQEIGGASLRTFERLFLDETGVSLAAWRRQSRMLASLSLLAEGKSVNAVARAVGYESAAAFSAAFKQCFGVPPTGYETGRGGEP